MDQNPQNQPTPQTPPQAPVPQQQTQLPTNKKSKKGLFIGLGIGAGVLLLGLIVLAVVLVSMGVSKADYKKAYDATREVSSTLSGSYTDTFALTYITSSNTETQLTNKIDSLETSLSKFEESNAELENLKAIKSDKEAKKSYGEYSSKADAYMKFTKDLVDSKSVFLAISTCEKIESNGTSDPAEAKKALTPCKQKLAEAKATDSDLKKVLDEYKTFVGTVEDVIDSAASTSRSDPDYYTKSSTLRKKLYESQDVLQDAVKDANSNLSKKYKDISPRAPLNDLNDYLFDKSLKK